jgi:S1-C subfamily serine protease
MNISSKSLATRRRALTVLGTIAGGSLIGRTSLAQGLGDVPSVVAASKPSVFAVGLFSRMSKPAFRFAGTCFAVEGDRFVTCAHVVQAIDPSVREVLSIAVAASDGTRIFEVKVAATRRESDLAVLEPVNPLPMPIKALRLSNTLPAEGSDVILIGFPIGSALGLNAATHRGVVSSVVPMAMPLPTTSGLEARNVQALRNAPIEILQLDATAYPGNSGGPVIDVRTGLVVGVVSLALVKGTRESAIGSPSGISYAVPVQQLTGMLPAR